MSYTIAHALSYPVQSHPTDALACHPPLLLATRPVQPRKKAEYLERHQGDVRDDL